MTTQNQNNKKRAGIFALAVVLILAGIATVFLWSNSFLIHSIGLLTTGVGVYLVVISKFSNGPSRAASRRPSPTMWAVGALLLAAVGFSNFLKVIKFGVRVEMAPEGR